MLSLVLYQCCVNCNVIEYCFECGSVIVWSSVVVDEVCELCVFDCICDELFICGKCLCLLGCEVNGNVVCFECSGVLCKGGGCGKCGVVFGQELFLVCIWFVGEICDGYVGGLLVLCGKFVGGLGGFGGKCCFGGGGGGKFGVLCLVGYGNVSFYFGFGGGNCVGGGEFCGFVGGFLCGGNCFGKLQGVCLGGCGGNCFGGGGGGGNCGGGNCSGNC